MTRTTPPRRVDVAAVIPALAPLARTATRLHPRPGNPSPQDSSVGGPLLWPVSEPWPHCDRRHELDGVNPARSLADVRLERRIRAAADGRSMTERERAVLARIGSARMGPITTPPVVQPYEGSIPMLPVAQLYARDVPGLCPPDGTDLLQVLWCPFDHPPQEYMPRTALFWRAADLVTDVRTVVPEPVEVQHEGYVPEPCTVAPEQVTEYPAPLELGKHLREEVQTHMVDADLYDRELCVAPGWKVGGWIHWGLTDPYAQPCPSCGTPTEPLLTIAGYEWDGADTSWIPYEDRAAASAARRIPDPARPSAVQIGRGYDQIVRVCPASHDHPHVRLMQ